MHETQSELPRDAQGAEVRAGQSVRYQGQAGYVVRNVFVGCDGGRAVISPQCDLEIGIRAHTRELEVSPAEASLAPEAKANDVKSAADEQAALQQAQNRRAAIHRPPA